MHLASAHVLAEAKNYALRMVLNVTKEKVAAIAVPDIILRVMLA